MSNTAERPSAGRTALVLAISAAAAILVNALIAVIAVSLGAPADFGPLTPPAYATFTVAGILAGWVGWLVVRARAKDPRRTLSWLVPAVGLVSFTPDVVLLATGFIPGTTTVGVVALMLMHLVVIACALPAYAILAPVAPARVAAASVPISG